MFSLYTEAAASDHTPDDFHIGHQSMAKGICTQYICIRGVYLNTYTFYQKRALRAGRKMHELSPDQTHRTVQEFILPSRCTPSICSRAHQGLQTSGVGLASICINICQAPNCYAGSIRLVGRPGQPVGRVQLQAGSAARLVQPMYFVQPLTKRLFSYVLNIDDDFLA